MNELAKQRVGAFFPLRAPALAAIVKGAGTRRVPKRRGSAPRPGRTAGHGGVAGSAQRPSARPAALATEPITAVPRRGTLHGARLLASASLRGPGLRVGGCHWSAGAGAPSAPPALTRPGGRRLSAAEAAGQRPGKGRCDWKTTQKPGRSGSL